LESKAGPSEYWFLGLIPAITAQFKINNKSVSTIISHHLRTAVGPTSEKS